MRHFAIVPLAAAVGLLASYPLTLKMARAVVSSSSPIMPVREIKQGMKGYGLTVFRGTEPERFDVEVIGTITNFRPHQDLVLVRTSHPRLEIAKVVAGMSGSPVYINGRMIGAYAYGWTFGAEPIAGVTPIQSMLDELARPLPILSPLPLGSLVPGRRDSSAASGRRAALDGAQESPFYAAAAGEYDLREHARQLAARASLGTSSNGPRLSPVSTPILLGGMGERSSKVARELLEPMGLDPVQGGGAGDGVEADAPTHYVDGGAVGVQMVSGDISAMGLGTVTRVEGNKLVAFGHPMSNGGVTLLPTAIAKVLWVLASQQRSFKLGQAVRPMGALVNDRQAAIVVDAKAVAPTFPATVEIRGVAGAPHHNWSFTVAHDKFLSPSFVALAVGNAIEATTAERRDVTWRADSEITITGFGTIKLEDAGVAVGGTPDSDDWTRSRAVRAVGAVLNNPWQEAHIEKVSTKIDVRFARDSYRLRGVDALEDTLEPGRPARLRLHLLPFSGPEELKVVEVPIPLELAGKDVEIELSPGYSETPELPSPERLVDLIANLPRQTFPLDSIVASIKLAEQGVAFHGQVASRLPPSALDVLRPASDSVAPEPFVSYLRTAIPIGRFIEGKDRARVHVKPVVR